MPDPEILNVLGVEMEIRAWRGTDNLFEATLTDAVGAPIPLGDSRVTLTIVDRPGGTVKFSQTNAPAEHTDAVNGITRFMVPRGTFAGLTGQRDYTWKYQIERHDITLDTSNIHFYGDFRVKAASAGIAPLALSVDVADELSVAEGVVAV